MAQAVRDLMTGDLLMTMPLVTRTLVELHDTGKIKLLAVTAPKRLDVAPDIPTAIEAGVPNMIAAEFFYLFAPAGTPVPVLQYAQRHLARGADRRRVQEQARRRGLRPACSPAGSTKRAGMFEAERARWLPIAEAAGTKIN